MTWSKATTRRAVGLAASTIVGGLLLVVASRHVPPLPQRFAVSWTELAGYAATVAAYHWVRAWRWHGLVRTVEARRTRTNLAIAWVGFLWIVLLPVRLGELVRPALLARITTVSFARASGGVLLERVVDAAIIAGLFLAAPLVAEGHLSNSEATRHLVSGAQWIALALLLTSLALLGAALAPKRLGVAVAYPVHRVAPKAATVIERLVEQLASGLVALTSIRAVVRFGVGTAIYWTLNAIGMWQLARACGIDLSLLGACTLMSILGLTLLLPSAPAQAGPFQLGIVLGLSLVIPATIAPDIASSYVTACYLTQLVVTAAFGLWGHGHLQLGWRGLGIGSDTDRSDTNETALSDESSR